MGVVAFRPSPATIAVPARPAGWIEPGSADGRLRLYATTVKLCLTGILASWISLQIGCVLSLLLHFHSGIIVGSIDGTIAFKFWAPIDYLVPTHALAHEFSPKAYPSGVSIAFSFILIVASIPFCASLGLLTRLFTFYSRGEVFTQRNAIIMRRVGHSLMATGYSPFLLGPAAHAIGVLKPITGVTEGMIAFFFMGMILLAISHVMTIGRRLQQDQEEIL